MFIQLEAVNSHSASSRAVASDRPDKNWGPDTLMVGSKLSGHSWVRDSLVAGDLRASVVNHCANSQISFFKENR